MKESLNNKSWWKNYLDGVCGIGGFCLANFVLCSIFYVICYLAVSVDRTDFAGNVFSFLLCISHYGTFCAACTVAFSLFRLIGKRTAGMISVIVSWLGIAMLCLDTQVFLLWHFHINNAMLALFLSPAGKELVSFSVSNCVAATAVFLAIGAVECVLWKFCMRFRFPKTVIVCLAVFCISAPVFHAWNAWVFFNGRNAFMRRTSTVPIHFGTTANDFIENLGFVPEHDTIDVRVADGSSVNYPLHKLSFSEKSVRPNILIIVVDSLRGDSFSPEIMPALSKRAESGAVFTNHVSCGNCTRTGLFTLFYGIPGNYWTPFLNSKTPSVLTSAAELCGYDFGIFSSATLVRPEIADTVFANVKNLRSDSVGNTTIQRDQNAIDDFIFFVSNRAKNGAKAPYFSMLMLDSLHANSLPENYPHYFPTDMDSVDYMRLNNNDETLSKRVLNFYRNQSRFIDEVLEKAFVRMEEAGALDNTVVILTGDHGQEANETRTNSWGHNSNFTRYQIHTPMIVWGIEGKRGLFDYRTTHYDVSVTLMRQMGCENPSSDYSVGKDLFDASERPFVLLSNYTGVAFLCGNKIYELVFDGSYATYDYDGKPCDFVPDRAVIQEYVDLSKRFL